MLGRTTHRALAAVLLLAAPALAQDQDRLRVRDETGEHTPPPDRDRVRLHTRDVLEGAGLTAAELAAVAPEAEAYAKKGGDPAELRATVREAKRVGCEGACLVEAVRAMNTAMNRGETAGKARHMVENAAREQARAKAPAATDAERGALVRERVEASLEEAARVRERDRARELDRERERDRTRERVRDPAARGPATR
jgi:hypothetical protein